MSFSGLLGSTMNVSIFEIQCLNKFNKLLFQKLRALNPFTITFHYIFGEYGQVWSNVVDPILIDFEGYYYRN